MLKFIKGHMTSIDGVELFPLISFVMFFTFFILVAVWVSKLKKGEVDEMANIPLKGDNN